MKIHTSLPTDKEYYDRYFFYYRAAFCLAIVFQIVSGATEIGAIYTATLQSLEPFQLGWIAKAVATFVAALSTAAIEVGIFFALPLAIDAVIFKRFSGADLPMSVLILATTILLLPTSGVISFTNSDNIMDALRPDAEQLATTVPDSLYAARKVELSEKERLALSSTTGNYENRLEALKTAHASAIAKKRRAYSNLVNKERRTGQSYATAKDRRRQQIADLEATRDQELAALTTERETALQEIRNKYQADQDHATAKWEASTREIKEKNDEAITTREAEVTSQGKSLAWVTIICLFLTIVFNIAMRFFRKDAGIKTIIQIEPYDFMRSPARERRSAQRQMKLANEYAEVKAMLEKIPAPQVLEAPVPLVDHTAAAAMNVVKVEASELEGENVVYIDPKIAPEILAAIAAAQAAQDEEEQSCDIDEEKNYNPPGFYREDQRRDMSADHENTADPLFGTNHEDSDPRTTELINQVKTSKKDLRKYKKRVSRHKQKAIDQERKSGKVCKRTADAITNNENHVNRLIAEIEEIEARIQAIK